jgi:hypothetical protein
MANSPSAVLGAADRASPVPEDWEGAFGLRPDNSTVRSGQAIRLVLAPRRPVETAAVSRLRFAHPEDERHDGARGTECGAQSRTEEKHADERYTDDDNQGQSNPDGGHPSATRGSFLVHVDHCI